MKIVLSLLLLCLAPAVWAQQTIWRCDQNGRAVYQQQPCEGRQVGKRDRRTTAQKRAEREAAKREQEKAAAEEAASQAAAASDAASANAAAATMPTVGAPATAPRNATTGAPVKGTTAPKRP